MQAICQPRRTRRITPFPLRPERRLSPRAYAIPPAEVLAAVDYFRRCSWQDLPCRGPREFARLIVHGWSGAFVMVFYSDGLVSLDRQGKGGAE